MKFKLIQLSPRPNGTPTILSLTQLTESSVELDWITTSTNELGFHIERSTDGINYSVIGSVASGIHNYIDTGLTEGLTYYYRIQAYCCGAINVSDYSSVAQQTLYTLKPALFPFTPPFNIVQTGVNTFVPDSSWDLQTYAGITVNKTYYLNSVTGNDGNNGITPLTPKKTWNAILATGDYDRVIMQDGTYLYKRDNNLAPLRDVEFIGEGTVAWTGDRTPDVGVFSLTALMTFTFQANIATAEYIGAISDASVLNIWGKPSRYIPRASIALVEANPGSFYWVGGVLYVHTWDGLTPQGRADIIYYDTSPIYWSKNNMKFYFENISCTISLQPLSVVGGVKMYIKDCILGAGTFWGVEELILEDVVCLPEIIGSGDAFNYSDLYGIPTKVIEINVEAGNCGSAGNDQASTVHNTSQVIRIGGHYHHSTGQNVADVDTVTGWMLGCEFDHSTSGVGIYHDGNFWLDGCVSHDNITDIQNSASSHTFIRDFTGSGINLISGTIDIY